MEKNSILVGRMFLYAVKIGVGSALSILIAEYLGLNFAASAGIITLLTISTTRTETLKLCFRRLSTFALAAVMMVVADFLPISDWLIFGLVLILLTFLLNLADLMATLSVNAVFLTHLMGIEKITLQDIFNELMLLLIGLAIAVCINHFQDLRGQQRYVDFCVASTERAFQEVFGQLSDYLQNSDSNNHVWDHVIDLERRLEDYLQVAFQYQENLLSGDNSYYVKYFEMRIQQCAVLHNLHYEIKKIRKMDMDAQLMVEFFDFARGHLTDFEEPTNQLQKLEGLIQEIQEVVPQSREDFIEKSRMYHILMDLEEFFMFQKRFVSAMAADGQAQFPVKIGLE